MIVRGDKGDPPRGDRETRPLAKATISEMIVALTRRCSRRALPKPNLVYFLWRFVANGLRTCRAVTTPVSSRDVLTLARPLTTEGIVVAPSERFLTDEGRQALRAAASSVLQISRTESVHAVVSGKEPGKRKKQFLIHLAKYSSGIGVDDPVLKVALDTRLLEIVASYLGLWPCLHSVGAWLNFPTDAPPEFSQLWHRDPEDLRLIKAFIYLVDVDERCGPFTYIPRSHPFGAAATQAQRLENKQRITDDLMMQAFSADLWRVCTGKANTMILADTVGYHRGGKPAAGVRILLTFTYTSGLPITRRTLSLAGMPKWISSDIQRWAVKPLLTASPSAGSQEKKKKGTGMS